MEFGLLGPLLVGTGTNTIAISGAKQRIVLAALLIRGNTVVPAERLIEAVWNGRPPRNVRTALQTHVMRLRRTLGRAAAERIKTSGPGYLAEVRPGELDLERFLTLREEGNRAGAAGEWERARSLLHQALHEWRDAVLLDVPSALLHSEVDAHLSELRSQTVAARIDADLALGGHAAVLTEIRQLIDQQPFNERVHARLMLALYRSGRQSEALAVYRDIRRLLVDDLGVEPGRELREMQHRILAADPELLGSPAVDAHSELTASHSGSPAVRTRSAGLPCAAGPTERVGYARCGLDQRDLSAQREILLGLDVPEHRIYLDHGLAGSRRDRPGLGQALAAVRAGDTLVVPRLDRLARSVPDARHIGESLTARQVKLSLGRTLYDPTDPMGRMFFDILVTFAEFEDNLLRMRTREGMEVARAKGRLKGKQPKLSARQQALLVQQHQTGTFTIADLADLFSVSRATVYRVLERAQAET